MTSLTTKSNIDLYREQIKLGKVKVPKTIHSLFKFLDKVKKERNVEFNQTLGQRPIRFIEEFCRHDKGEWAGKIIKLELWQKAILEIAYGYVEKGTENRYFKDILLVVARKNGKSLLASGLSLYSLMADGIKGAEIYMIATQKDQARIVFDSCRNMVKQSPRLSKRLRVLQHEIKYEDKLCKMKPLATEGSAKNSLDGLNPSMTVLDEIHAYPDMNKINVIASGMGSRKEPLLWKITTAGHTRFGAFDEQYQFAKKVLSLSTDGSERMLPILYELDDEKDYDKPEEWIKANPNLNVSKTMLYLKGELQKAKEMPQKMNEFLTKHCNIQTNDISAFFDLHNVEKNDNLQFKMEDFTKLGELKDDPYPVIVGIDLSHTGDLTGVSFMFKKPNSKMIYCDTMTFMAEEQLIKNTKSDKQPYGIWYKKGLIRTNPGSNISHRNVFDYVVSVVNKYNLKIWKIAIDPWGAKPFIDLLKNEGINTDFLVEEVRQGAKTFSQPLGELKGIVEDGLFNYNHNPVMKWNLLNVGIKMDDNNNIRPIKLGPTLRNDLFMSALNAYVILMKEQVDYDDYIETYSDVIENKEKKEGS